MHFQLSHAYVDKVWMLVELETTESPFPLYVNTGFKEWQHSAYFSIYTSLINNT